MYDYFQSALTPSPNDTAPYDDERKTLLPYDAMLFDERGLVSAIFALALTWSVRVRNKQDYLIALNTRSCDNMLLGQFT